MCNIADPERIFHLLALLLSAIDIIYILSILVIFRFLKRTLNTRKYTYIFIGGLVLVAGIFFIGPWWVNYKKYSSYPGPAYVKSKDLKSFIESRTWVAGECQGSSYQFNTNGTFTYQFYTDYPVPAIEGKWILQDLGNGEGTLVLISSQFNPPQEKVVVQADGKLLKIDLSLFHGLSSKLRQP